WDKSTRQIQIGCRGCSVHGTPLIVAFGEGVSERNQGDGERAFHTAQETTERKHLVGWIHEERHVLWAHDKPPKEA
ncbi:hypothetical protein DXG01_011264, partial [Tephrocybe rancida]